MIKINYYLNIIIHISVLYGQSVLRYTQEIFIKDIVIGSANFNYMYQ